MSNEREEKIEMDGCAVTLRFAEKSNPDVLKRVQKIMLEQRIVPGKCGKFEDQNEKC